MPIKDRVVVHCAAVPMDYNYDDSDTTKIRVEDTLTNSSVEVVAIAELDCIQFFRNDQLVNEIARKWTADLILVFWRFGCLLRGLVSEAAEAHGEVVDKSSGNSMFGRAIDDYFDRLVVRFNHDDASKSLLSSFCTTFEYAVTAPLKPEGLTKAYADILQNSLKPPQLQNSSVSSS